MTPDKAPQPTPEQRRRDELQVQWLISALRRLNEPRPHDIDENTLAIGRHCPTCGAAWWGVR